MNGLLPCFYGTNATQRMLKVVIFVLFFFVVVVFEKHFGKTKNYVATVVGVASGSTVQDRKWSPKWTANDPERKIWMAWTQLAHHRVNFIIITKSQIKSEILLLKKLNEKKKSFTCKNEAVGNTRLLPHVNMLLVPIIFFLWRVDYTSGGKHFDWALMWFLPLISYWEVMTRILIFCGHCFWSAWFALWCQRISFDLFWNAMLFIAAK